MESPQIVLDVSTQLLERLLHNLAPAHVPSRVAFNKTEYFATEVAIDFIDVFTAQEAGLAGEPIQDEIKVHLASGQESTVKVPTTYLKLRLSLVLVTEPTSGAAYDSRKAGLAPLPLTVWFRVMQPDPKGLALVLRPVGGLTDIFHDDVTYSLAEMAGALPSGLTNVAIIKAGRYDATPPNAGLRVAIDLSPPETADGWTQFATGRIPWRLQEAQGEVAGVCVSAEYMEAAAKTLLESKLPYVVPIDEGGIQGLEATNPSVHWRSPRLEISIDVVGKASSVPDLPLGTAHLKITPSRTTAVDAESGELHTYLAAEACMELEAHLGTGALIGFLMAIVGPALPSPYHIDGLRGALIGGVYDVALSSLGGSLLDDRIDGMLSDLPGGVQCETSADGCRNCRTEIRLGLPFVGTLRLARCEPSDSGIQLAVNLNPDLGLLAGAGMCADTTARWRHTAKLCEGPSGNPMKSVVVTNVGDLPLIVSVAAIPTNVTDNVGLLKIEWSGYYPFLIPPKESRGVRVRALAASPAYDANAPLWLMIASNGGVQVVDANQGPDKATALDAKTVELLSVVARLMCEAILSPVPIPYIEKVKFALDPVPFDDRGRIVERMTVEVDRLERGTSLQGRVAGDGRILAHARGTGGTMSLTITAERGPFSMESPIFTPAVVRGALLRGVGAAVATPFDPRGAPRHVAPHATARILYREVGSLALSEPLRGSATIGDRFALATHRAIRVGRLRRGGLVIESLVRSWDGATAVAGLGHGLLVLTRHDVVHLDSDLCTRWRAPLGGHAIAVCGDVAWIAQAGRLIAVRLDTGEPCERFEIGASQLLSAEGHAYALVDGWVSILRTEGPHPVRVPATRLALLAGRPVAIRNGVAVEFDQVGRLHARYGEVPWGVDCQEWDDCALEARPNAQGIVFYDRFESEIDFSGAAT